MIIFVTVVVSVVIGLFVERILFKKFKEGKSNKEFKTSEYLLGGLVIQTVIIVLSCVIGLYINDLAVEKRELDDAVTKTQNMVEICNREIRNNNNYMSKYTSGEKSIEYFKLNAHLNLDYYDIVLLDTSVQKYMDAEAFYNAYVYHSRIKLNLEKADAAENEEDYLYYIKYAMYYEAAMVDALEIGVDSMLKNLSHDEVVDEFKKMLEEKEDGKVIKSYYEPKYKVKN